MYGGMILRKIFGNGGEIKEDPINTRKNYKAKDIYDLFFTKYGIDKDKWFNAVGVMTMHEGRGIRTQVQVGGGPGRGAWQIEPAAAKTMINQYKNIAKSHGFKLPSWVSELEKYGKKKYRGKDGRWHTGYNVAVLGKQEQLELLMANYSYGKPNKVLIKWRDGKADIGELWADGWKKSFTSNTSSKSRLMEEVNAGDTLSISHINKLVFKDNYVDPAAFSNKNKDKQAKDHYITAGADRKKYRCEKKDAKCNKSLKFGGILYKK